MTLSCASIGEDIGNALIPYKDFPREGITFRDISPILENPTLFSQIIDAFYERYQDKGVDAIIALESRGFLFGSTLAYKLKVPLVMVRKEGKLPGDVYRVAYKKIYGEDVFVMRKEALKPGQKVVIVDDFFSTGGSLDAAAQMVEMAGGSVYEGAFLINNTLAPNRLTFSFPIFTLYEL